MVRKWASLRMQTLYRTVSGMMKHRRALELLTATEHPELDAAERAEVVDGKFRCLVALQRYAVMAPSELADEAKAAAAAPPRRSTRRRSA